MPESRRIRVGMNGYGMIGKRVADALARQDDMATAGVCDISVDWRIRQALRKGFLVFA